MDKWIEVGDWKINLAQLAFVRREPNGKVYVMTHAGAHEGFGPPEGKQIWDAIHAVKTAPGDNPGVTVLG